MADDVVTLIVGGAEYHGWTQVLVSRAITQACSAFQVSLNDAADLRVDVRPGQECEIRYGADTLITGAIDAVEINYAADSHDIAISGRSKTRDVIDSWLDPLQFRGLGVEEIIRRIARQFGVGVTIAGDASGLQMSTGGFSVVPDQDFAVQASDGLAFGAIQDAAGRAGWYLSDSPTGDLVLSRTAGTVSQNEIVVVPGNNVNVLGCSYRNDESNRYNTYRVIGQNTPTDDSFGLDTAQIMAEVTDPDIGRNRLRIITAETGLTTVQAQTRAIQERQAAIAESFGIEYVVQGWRGSASVLWRENQIVNVRDEILGVRRPLLIDTVNYIQDVAGGTTCRLSLVLPEARQPAAVSTDSVLSREAA
jgi:prophage tail gpP-like protein